MKPGDAEARKFPLASANRTLKRPRLQEIRRLHVYCIITVSLVMLVAISFSILLMSSKPSLAAASCQKRYAIMVAGYLTNSDNAMSGFNDIRSKLIQDVGYDYPPIGYGYNFPQGLYDEQDTFNSMPGYAPYTLSQLVKKIVQDCDGARIDIVAHSLGGAIALQYAKTFGTDQYGVHVRHIVTLDSPVNGSSRAKLVFFQKLIGGITDLLHIPAAILQDSPTGRYLVDLRDDNGIEKKNAAFVQKLRETTGAVIKTFSSRDDLFVPYLDAAIPEHVIEFSLDRETDFLKCLHPMKFLNYLLACIGHDQILHNADSLNALVAVLKDEIPPVASTPTPRAITSPVCSPNALVTADENLPDGAVITPGQSATKYWTFKNTGTCPWGTGYQLVFRSGHQLGAPPAVNVPSTASNATARVSVALQVPSGLGPGTYAGNWQLRNPNGTYFGNEVWYKLVVPGSNSGGGNAPGSGAAQVNLNVTGTIRPLQEFRPSVTVPVTSGYLSKTQGDMLRFYGGTNYTRGEFPHVAVEKKVDTGQSYTFTFYSDNPFVAPSSNGTYTSVWRVWANGGWVGPEIPITFTVGVPSNGRPPNAPTLISPGDWHVEVGRTPQLCAHDNGDPDGDTVSSYFFEIFNSAQTPNSGWISNGCWSPPGLNSFTFEWRARVRDSRGVESDWSASRHFTIESTTLTITRFDTNPPGPSNADRVRVLASVSGCAGLEINKKVLINRSADGTVNGEWVQIGELGGPNFTEQDGPVWDTLDYEDGIHLIRLVLTSCDKSTQIRDLPYSITRRKPGRAFSVAPTRGIDLDSRTVTFRWKPAPRAENYTLIVGTTDAPQQSTVLRKTLSSTAFTHTFDRDYPRLYWLVSTANELGEWEEGGWNFSVDTSPPTAAVDAGRTGTVVYDPQFAVYWDGSSGSGSAIRGFDVQVREESSSAWSDWLAGYPERSAVFTGRPGGKYGFRARATDAAGNIGIFATAPEALVMVDPAKRPPQPWWQTSYVQKRQLSLLNRLSDRPLPAGSAMRVRLDNGTSPTASEIFSASLSTVKGNDLRIVHKDQTELARHVASFTPNLVDIWFATNEIIGSGQSSSDYNLYIGHAEASTPPSATTTIFPPGTDASALGSWTFEDATGTVDVTNHGKAITWNAPPSIATEWGLHGRGARFVGNQGGHVMAGSPVGDQLTAEMWAYFEHTEAGGLPDGLWTELLNKFSPADNNSRWHLILASCDGGVPCIRAMLYVVPNGSQDAQERSLEATNIQPDRWYHIALTFDGSVMRLWINGQVAKSTTFAPARVFDRGEEIRIGGRQLSTPAVNFRLDGVRISNVGRVAFPYGTVTVPPQVAVGAAQTRAQQGQANVVIQKVTAVPNPDGGQVVTVTIENQGQYPTYNEFMVHVYRDMLPTGPGDLKGSIGFWVNAPLQPGQSISLTRVVQAATGNILANAVLNEQSFALAAQADSTGVLNLVSRAKTIAAGPRICVTSADGYGSSAEIASPLAIGGVQHRNTYRSGASGWARFDTVKGRQYTLRTANLGVAADTVLSLHGSAGATILAENDDDGTSLASRVEWTAPTSDTYYVQVRHWDAAASGCGTTYDLLLESADPAVPTATSLPATATNVSSPVAATSTTTPAATRLPATATNISSPVAATSTATPTSTSTSPFSTSTPRVTATTSVPVILPTGIATPNTATGGLAVLIPTRAAGDSEGETVLESGPNAPFVTKIKVPFPANNQPAIGVRIQPSTLIDAGVVLPAGVTVAKVVAIDVFNSATGALIHNHSKPLELTIQLSTDEMMVCTSDPSKIALLHIDAAGVVTRVPISSLNCTTGTLTARLTSTSSFAVAKLNNSMAITLRMFVPIGPQRGGGW